MISLDQALTVIAANTHPIGSETIDISNPYGRVLAASVKSLRSQPPFHASAMDGYAVRSSDLSGKAVILSVVGESAAGRASTRQVDEGECIRVSTGAVMPAGADQVVIQENCARKGDTMTTGERSQPGQHIRATGIDFHADQVLLTPGTRITAAALSLAVSGGITRFTVRNKPRVGVLSTGDELVEPGQGVGTDKIINSIGPGLSALIGQWGGTAVYLGIARDDPQSVRAKLAATRDLDVLVTIGGASVGNHDHLRQVFSEMGGRLFFEKIAIKPGKPTWFGAYKETLVLGLPGNPVSAMVMAHLCLKPLLDIMLGCEARLPFRQGRLGSDLPANGPRETMARARHDDVTGTLEPVANQDSSALSGLVAANALIRRPQHAPAAQAGETVEYLLLAEL